MKILIFGFTSVYVRYRCLRFSLPSENDLSVKIGVSGFSSFKGHDSSILQRLFSTDPNRKPSLEILLLFCF